MEETLVRVLVCAEYQGAGMEMLEGTQHLSFEEELEETCIHLVGFAWEALEAYMMMEASFGLRGRSCLAMQHLS